MHARRACMHHDHIPFYVFVTITERPEESYDHRTLYERLKVQKDKKQEEFLEQLKFSEYTYT